MGLRVISSMNLITNGTINTNTTTAIDVSVGGKLTMPTMTEKSGNSPEASYLPVKTMLRLQPLDTPMHFKIGNTSGITATVDDIIVSPNNPVLLEFQDKSQVPTYIATFCEGGTSKVLNVAWVSRENE